MIERTTLPGGQVVVTDDMPGSRSASFGVWVATGSRDEPDALHGVAHFLEHLLFKGTATRSPRDVVTAIEGVGGDVNAYTGREHMVVHCRVPSRCALDAVDVLCDVVSTPRLDDDDMELERHVILDELAGAAELPEDEAQREASERLFPGHGLGRETLGSAASVTGLSVAELRTWFAAEFAAAPLVVAGAGGIGHDAVVAVVEQALSGHRVRADRPDRPAPPPAVGAAVDLRRPAEQGHLLMAWRSLPSGHADRWPLAVLTQLLGGGMASRLFQSIREERGLVYGIDASQTSFTDAGVLEVVAASDPGDLDEVVDLVVAEVDDLARSGPTEAELAVATGFLVGALELAEEDSASRMVGLGAAVCDRDELPDLEADLAAIRAVTVDEVGRLAGELLTADPVTVRVRPDRERAPLRRS